MGYRPSKAGNNAMSMYTLSETDSDFIRQAMAERCFYRSAILLIDAKHGAKISCKKTIYKFFGAFLTYLAKFPRNYPPIVNMVI